MITLHSTFEHYSALKIKRCRLLAAVLSDYINHNRGHWVHCRIVESTIMDCKWVSYHFMCIKHGRAEVYWWITLALGIKSPRIQCRRPASSPAHSHSSKVFKSADWLKWDRNRLSFLYTTISLDRTQSAKKCKGDTNSNGGIVVCYLTVMCPHHHRKVVVLSRTDQRSHWRLWVWRAVVA